MTHVTVKLNNRYKNRTGEIITISGKISIDNRWYYSGYRFTDTSDTMYRSDGSHCPNKMTHDYDLVEECL